MCVCGGGGGGWLKYPMKMQSFGLTETKLFNFHKIFKNEELGVQVNPL